MRSRPIRRRDDLHALLVRRSDPDEEREEEEHRGEQVVGERPGRDRDDAGPERRVRVAPLVAGILVLVGVHPRNLHVGEEGDDRDLERGRAVLGLLVPDARPEADRELDDAHAVSTRGKVVTALVDDHQQGQPENADHVVGDGHRHQHNSRFVPSPAKPSRVVGRARVLSSSIVGSSVRLDAHRDGRRRSRGRACARIAYGRLRVARQLDDAPREITDAASLVEPLLGVHVRRLGGTTGSRRSRSVARRRTRSRFIWRVSRSRQQRTRPWTSRRFPSDENARLAKKPAATKPIRAIWTYRRGRRSPLASRCDRCRFPTRCRPKGFAAGNGAICTPGSTIA